MLWPCGLAHSGTDYQYYSLPPIYPISWEFSGPTRMHSDGQFGADGLMQDIYGELFKYGVNGPASVNINLINNTASSGNLNGQLQMANPSQQDAFYLGGQDIPLGVALGISQTPLTLVDNSHQDGVFSFSLQNYIATNSPLSIGISRTNGSFGVVQMSYQTLTNGSTAQAGVDYRPTNGVITFANSQTSRLVPADHPEQQFLFTPGKGREPAVVANIRDLSGGTAQLGQTNAVVRIINPNFPGYLNFSAPSFSGTLSSGVINFTVTRSVGSEGTLTVQYGTYDFTMPPSPLNATNKVDYTGSTNTLTWNNGDVSPRTVSIPLLNTNNVGGGDKVFGVALSSPTLQWRHHVVVACGDHDQCHSLHRQHEQLRHLPVQFAELSGQGKRRLRHHHGHPFRFCFRPGASGLYHHGWYCLCRYQLCGDQ